MQILLYHTDFVSNEKHKLIHLLKKKRSRRKYLLPFILMASFLINTPSDEFDKIHYCALMRDTCKIRSLFL